jgi:hypothetical protein
MTSMKLSALPLLLAASGVAWYARPAPGPSSEPTPSPPVVSLPQNDPPAAPPVISLPQDDPPTERTIKLTIVDAETGDPLRNLAVTASQARTGRDEPGQKLITDAEGTVTARFPSLETARVEVRIHADGYVPIVLMWPIGPGQKLPDNYTARLERGTTIGGRVVDEQGNPVAGSKVLVWVPREDRVDRLPVLVDLFQTPFTTDADGRWRCDVVPADLKTVLLQLNQPSFLDYSLFASSSTAPNLDQLRAQSAEIVLKAGRPVEGLVLDDATDQPIAGATVQFGTDFNSSNASRATTDAQGRFRLAAPEEGPGKLTAQAPGHAPETAEILVGEKLDPVSIRLRPGRTIRGRVVDPEGKPIPGALLVVDSWRGIRSLNLQTRADADGSFALQDAPDDPIEAQVAADGFMNRPGLTLSPSTAPREIMLNRPLRVSGSVTDAMTGEPIAAFTVTPTFNAENPPHPGDRRDTSAFGDGKFQVYSTWPVPDSRVFWFEANGYKPLASRPVRFDEGTVTIDLAMTKGTIPLRAPVSGVALLPDGSPAAEATVYLATREHDLYIQGGKPLYPDRALSTSTDASGSFRFPPQTEPGLVVILDDRGFALRPDEELATSPLKLAPWGRIVGEIRANGAPVPFASAHATLQTDLIGKPVNFELHASTDDHGLFAIDRVPPGGALITRSIDLVGAGRGMVLPAQPIQIEPGETTKVVVGGNGRSVAGRVSLPEKYNTHPSHSAARLDLLPPPAPEIPERLTPDERQAWYRKWAETAAGRAYVAWQQDRRSYPVLIDLDGSFRIDDVVEGTYSIALRLTSPDSDQPLSAHSDPIVIPPPPADAPHAPLDLGEVPIQVQEP